MTALMQAFRSAVWSGGLAACLCLVWPALGEEITNKARVELVIGSTTPAVEAEELINRFNTLNPGVSIQYPKILSTNIFEDVVNPKSSKNPIDVAWSSAMDLQIKLANDGYAADYLPADIDAIPSWAQWKGRAYGVTAEPVIIIFNKRLLREDLVPQNRADLLRVLTEDAETFRGKIATYDPELSGTGLLFITQDLRVTAQTWKLIGAMGNAGVRLYASSLPMIDRVCSGELLLAYNIMASYALERVKAGCDLGIIFPTDYTLLFSRIVLIPRTARQPDLARRFVDFLLSKEGQGLLASHSLGSVRDDMKSSIPGFTKAGAVFRPISLSLDLLTYLDQSKRKRFLKDWKDALHGQ